MYITVALSSGLIKAYAAEERDPFLVIPAGSFPATPFQLLLNANRREVVVAPKMISRGKRDCQFAIYGLDGKVQREKFAFPDGEEGTLDVVGRFDFGSISFILRCSDGYWRYLLNYPYHGHLQGPDPFHELGDPVDFHFTERGLRCLFRHSTPRDGIFEYRVQEFRPWSGFDWGQRFRSDKTSASLICFPIGPHRSFIGRTKDYGLVEGRVRDSGGLLQLDSAGRLRVGVFGDVVCARALVGDLSPLDFYSAGSFYITRSCYEANVFYVVRLLDEPWPCL